MRRLRRIRDESARLYLEIAKGYYEQGTVTLDRFLDASRVVMESEAEAADPAGVVAAKQAHLGRISDLLERHLGHLYFEDSFINGVGERESQYHEVEAAQGLGQARREMGDKP